MCNQKFRSVRSLGFDSATKAMSELAKGSDILRLDTLVVSALLATVHCSLSHQKNVRTSSMNSE